MHEIDGNAPLSRIRSISRMSKILSKFLATYTPENTVLASSSDSAYGGQTCFSWLPGSGSATEVDILEQRPTRPDWQSLPVRYLQQGWSELSHL